MQPLYTVDHESRHNSNHVAEPETVRPEEQTPLLHHFSHNVSERNPLTMVIVSLLLIILIAGVIIGIYLLILQNESENVLPPVDSPLKLVSRSQWDPIILSRSAKKSFPYGLKDVIVVQTGTVQCVSTESCTKLLQEMKANATTANTTMPYNFMISSNGQTYEALGWQNTATGFVLAFIGNFAQGPPERLQLEEAKNFFATMVSQQYLHPSFRIISKNDTPTYLRQSLSGFPQWSTEFSYRN